MSIDYGEIVAERIAQEAQEQADTERQMVREKAQAWLDKWSIKLSDVLPAGIQGDSNQCVFAHALGGSFSHSQWTMDARRSRVFASAGILEGNPDTGLTLNLPPEVSEFIRRFDAGEYPDLIEAS